MAKIIQFDLSRKIRPKYYTPETMRGRVLEFKSRSASTESARVATAAAHMETLAGREPNNTKIS